LLRSGEKIDAQEAKMLAELLIARQIAEIEEAIVLLEEVPGLRERDAGREIIVHDGEGEHRIEKPISSSSRQGL